MYSKIANMQKNIMIEKRRATGDSLIELQQKLNILNVLKANAMANMKDNDPRNERENSIPTDDEVLKALNKQLKQLKDSKELFEKGERLDLVSQTNIEIDVVMSLLPKQMSTEELKDFIKAKIDSIGIEKIQKNMGKIMKELQPELNGKADGKTISNIVKEFLN